MCVRSWLCLVVTLALGVGACGSDDTVDEAARDRCEAQYGVGECVERDGEWVPLERATSTTTTTSSTTSSTSTTSTTTAMRYGSPCTAGSHRDCIDPEGDGQYTYLEGGGDCMTTFRESPGLCSDLDGDGRAGYPDSG